MPVRLDSGESGFERDFMRLLDSKRDDSADVSRTVAGIISSVKERGDEALLELTRQFDAVTANAVSELAIGEDAIAAATEKVDARLLDALNAAATRIRSFHEKQKPTDIDYTDDAGVSLGMRNVPVNSAGLYVPGGKACYPSSVLMSALPAAVAEVPRRVMVMPTPGGEIPDAVLAAAGIAGVTEIWRIGGAQAIAALAYGTQTIAPVDKIIGPGNAFVAEAKRQVFGKVGIDAIAGPSEILVMADPDSDPEWIALDLLSQAEHDEAAQSILITTDAKFGKAVEAAVEKILPELPRKDIITASWRNHGAIIIVRDWKQGLTLANRIAPEHLQIVTKKPEKLAANITNAGAIFIGPYTPEAIGDYIGGPNHILPTGRTARFSSGLGVVDFTKRISVLGCDSANIKTIGEHAATLAEAEGLDAHGLSILRRLGR